MLQTCWHIEIGWISATLSNVKCVTWGHWHSGCTQTAGMHEDVPRLQVCMNVFKITRDCSTTVILCNSAQPSDNYNRCMALWILSMTTRVSWYQKGKTKTNLDFLEQETVSSSGISWAICKSAPHSRQITTPESHHSVFYRPDALPVVQPTASNHRRHEHWRQSSINYATV